MLLILAWERQGISQTPKEKIETRLTEADSVLIVTHETTGEGYLRPDDRKPGLLDSGKVNYHIISEIVKLTAEDIATIIPVFARLSRYDAPREERGCFRLNHAMLIFKNQAVSFIDLGLECETFWASKDLLVNNNLLDFEKIRRLFKKNGLKHPAK